MHIFYLLKDELKYFAKTRMMLYLWIGTPLITIATQMSPIKTPGITLSEFSIVMTTSLLYLIAGPLLTSSIIKDISEGTYILFIVRPIKKSTLLLARFYSIMICLLTAQLISLIIASFIQLYQNPGTSFFNILHSSIPSLFLGLSLITISCALGILIGVATTSLYKGIILFIFIGVNLNNTIIYLFQNFSQYTNITSYYMKSIAVFLVGIILGFIFLKLGIFIFNKK